MAMLRDAPSRAPTLDVVERWAQRAEANLDALRIAGEAAHVAARDALDDDPDAAAVLAFLLAESARVRPSSAKLAVALLGDESLENRQAARW